MEQSYVSMQGANQLQDSRLAEKILAKSEDYANQQEVENKERKNELDGKKGQQHISLDTVLSQIGIGQYQYLVYAIMATLGLTEGSQITVFTLMIPLLHKEWDVSDNINELQTSLVFLGFIIGSLFSGKIADRYGRRIPFLYSTLFTVIFTLGQCLCVQIVTLIIMRTFTGILVGFFGPLGVTILAEITPIEVRGKFMSIITVSLNIGQLFGYLMGYLTLDGLESGNWRLLIFLTGFPGILATFMGYYFLDDSVRYELQENKYDSAFNTINQITKSNKSNFVLTQDIQQKLQLYAESVNKIYIHQQKASLSSLFKQKGKIITPLVWLNWFTLSFMYYGIFIMLPTIIDQQNGNDDENSQSQEDIKLLFLSSGSEIIGGALASVLIVIKGLGRKKTIIFMFLMQALFAMMTYFFDGTYLVWATLSRFFNTISFIFTYQFTAELYPTKIRTTGIGMANGIGRIGGVVMPWICFSMSAHDLFSPFLLFGSLSIFTAVINLTFPIDTEGKQLDSIPYQQSVVKNQINEK